MIDVDSRKEPSRSRRWKKSNGKAMTRATLGKQQFLKAENSAVYVCFSTAVPKDSSSRSDREGYSWLSTSLYLWLVKFPGIPNPRDSEIDR